MNRFAWMTLSVSVLMHGAALAALWWQGSASGKAVPDVQVSPSSLIVSIQNLPASEKQAVTPIETLSEAPAEAPAGSRHPPMARVERSTLSPPPKEKSVAKPVPVPTPTSVPMPVVQEVDIEPVVQAPIRYPAIAPAPKTEPLPASQGMAAPAYPVIEVAKAKPRYEMGQALTPRPKYPMMARRQGWQGRVALKALVAPDGRLLEVTLEESSGFAVLDQAAIKTVNRWQLQASSSAASEWIWIPVEFRLR